ncbi:hypothetical protein CTA2_9774 [Colletotrichum tanaceti]|uniref:Steroid 5-alpha reductase C-terminal domain-containing protein n=1 Tax=Colletotrichum tanaceti TaxID=1306861 RepID=A0A4U6XAD0_9PEZI|nr:hypothetical protein CTA2_9771 [Colletotrichum tanaceti]KAJ0165843.1 hypothetical protein CTA2_9774 [Colletotrichum tanaceti]TKW52630.1 hypothetical protein CTA1_12540 [Colletotrichum tanaceti]
MSDRGEGWNARLGVNTNEIPTPQHLPNATSGAEQDRYGGWFGGKVADKAGEKMDQAAEAVKENLPRGAGAEQERYGGWFGGNKADKAADKIRENVPTGTAAQQEHVAGWFGDKADKAARKFDQAAETVKENLPRGAGAEQERYGGWFGGNKADKAADKIRENVPTGTAAEQERVAGWFGDKADKAARKFDQAAGKVKENMPRGAGAEQDRYEGWFGGDKLPSAEGLSERLPHVSGAEQDRYNRWFGGDKGPSGAWVRDHIPQASGAEQDRYASHWEGVADKLTDKIKQNVPTGTAAEQERVAGWFGDKADKAARKFDQAAETVKENLPRGAGAEQDRFGSHFEGKAAPSADRIYRKLPRVSGAEQDRYSSHFSLHPSNPVNTATTTTLGLLQNALLPSFGLHAGLSTVTYAVARYTDRAEAKDWLWPSGQVANAWWTAIGARVVHDGLSVPAAWNSLGYTQKLLLSGVSAWGVRLFYRVASRSVKRGRDDARYVAAKKRDPRFWDKAFFTMFLPEAALQALIALPFTLPFRAPLTCAASSPFTDYPETFHSLAVFLFTAGFALETLADSQLEDHSRNSKELNREGVWSIVRHPNYLGDALCHLSFPVLLYSAGMLHPLAALGPVFNYFILRYVGGDKENEASQEERYAKENPLKFQQLQEYKRDKNSFWPALAEYDNKWVLTVAAVGAVGVVVERGLLAYFRG